jgi:hypothetical protein
MTSLTSILSQTYAYVDPTAQPPTDPTPATLAAKIAARLTDLVLDSNNQSQARPLARCADAARTIASWLVIPRPGARTVRNGQAADALMVLCAELASLSVALKKEEWERVAEAVRSC